MNSAEILPTLNGERGSDAQFQILKHTIAAMIERAFMCTRVIGGGTVTATSMGGSHFIQTS
ncbi:MAG TPA: hypothetical protein VD994_07895 [Prosthecobacter sp.]|nr:hypothetical protein [Prosthecobacter sp.]